MTEKLFHYEIGQGKPLVCLHGYALDHTIWLRMADEIKHNVKLILPDLRGHGRSPLPDGKYSMRTMAEDVLRILDDQEIECAGIAGHSMGGYIALALAEHYSDRLSGFALVASHAFEDKPEIKKARIENIAKVRQSSVAEVLSEMPGKLTRHPEISEYCKNLIFHTSKNGIMGVLEGMAERSDRTFVLRSILIPKMIIAGVDDQYIPLETSRKFAAMVKELNLVEIAGAGHMPMMEKPYETGKALLNLFE
jgi:pimeloyl-ACP methyl ester carboxylesterase